MPRLEDRDLLDRMTRAPQCELCGIPNKTGLDPHHIISRGAGGPDHPFNVLSACRRCHGLIESHPICRRALWSVVAVRLGTTLENVEREVYRIIREGL